MKGEPLLLRRVLTTSPVTNLDLTVQGHARGYAPNELTGGVIQGDSVIILSPTPLLAANWPVPPKVNDKIIYGGRTRNVTSVAPISIGSSVVRYELQVRG